MFKRSRNRVVVTPTGVTHTQQHFKVLQDVNNIVARCLRGDMSGLKSHGICDDLSNLPDNLHEFMTKRLENSNILESVFDQLPDDVKSRFETPHKFLEALGDDTNKDFFFKHGIFSKKDSTPVRVEVVNPTEPTKPVTAPAANLS